MSFFSSIGNFFGNLFGGGDDEEKKKRQQGPTQNFQAPAKAPVAFGNANGNQNQQFTFQDPTNRQPANGLNLVLPGMTPNTKTGLPLLQKATPAPATLSPDDQKRAELDRLTKANLDAAREQRAQGESWWNRNVPIFSNKGDIERDAEVLARSRATNQYQEQHGWVRDPVVLDYGKTTLQKANEHAADLEAQGRRLKTVGDVATKAGQIAQYVPVTGSILNIGLAGAEHANIGGLRDDIRNQRNLNEFGMTSQEFDALDPETQGKLHTIRNIGYGLAPLDFLGLTGLAKSEGVNLAKDSAIQLVKEGAIDASKRAALKTLGVDTAKNLAKSAAVGTGVSLAGQQYLTGKMDPLEALKTGTLLAGTNELFNPTGLRKATPGTLDDAAREVAPGIKSANPNREADAAAAIEAAAREENQARIDQQMNPRGGATPPEDTNAPSFMRKAEKEAAQAADAAATDARAVEMGVGPSALDKPAFQHKQDIQNVIREGEQELNDWLDVNQNASPQEIDNAKTTIQAQVVQRITDLQQARAGAAAPEAAPALPRPAAAEPVPATPAAVQNAVAGAAPVIPGATEGALQTAAEATPAPAAVAEGTQPLELPTLPAGTAPAAPNTYDAIVKQIGGGRDANLKGKYAERNVLDLEQLKADAGAAIADMSDEQLVNSVAATHPDMLAHDPESFSLARASLDRLYAMKDNPVAQNQVSTILDAMSQYASKNAQGLRVVQEEFDNMPLPMKVRYLINKIDAANRDVKGYEPLSRDPAKASEIEAALSGRLQASQDIAERVAALENQLNSAADAARNGERVDVKPLVKEITRERQNLLKSNGEVVKYFQDLVPGRTKAQKALSDFPRMMMLSSFTGRINDIITTGATLAREQTGNITQGILAKAYNLVKGPGKVSDTTKGFGKLFTGAAEGTRKTIGEVGGAQYVEDIQRQLKGNEELRSGLRKAKGPIGRTIQAATEYATNLTEGARDQRVYQLADQEAAQLGLKGADRKQYAEARAAVPSRQMVDAANEVHMAVNNLNDNPISRTLAAVGKAMEGDNRFAKSGIGGLIKNQIIPFTSWLGGNIWNSVTDRNVIANTYKFIRDAKQGNPEGAIRNLSRAINGAVEGYVIGYNLAKAGVLTDKNAEGYNDQGLYLHIGDRYIPVGLFGAFAPNIVLGKAAHDGLNAPEGANPALEMGKAIGNFAWHGLALGNVLGTDTNISRAVDAGTRPGGDAGDAAAVATGGAAGQYIPALGQDVNAVLNQTDLNPTHEAADTRIQSTELTKSGEPSKAKDYKKSAVASLINRVPFASQQLPRKAGVAAPDLLDRTTRGDRETQTQLDEKAKAKTEADRVADFKARDIPDYAAKGFDDAVEARVQRGEYDKGIEALQAKLDHQSADKNIPESKNQDLKDEIKQLQVLKAGKYDPRIRDLYKSTSVTEWRNMGDPESEDYNPDLYQMLYNYDSALAKENISGSTLAHDKNKFTAKKKKSGSGGGRSGANSELKRIQSNKIGSLPSLPKFDFTLAPQKAGSYKAPTLQQVSSSDLIKKRKITVSKA